MAAPQRRLADDDARQAAIAVHDRCFLVEAGAGSGKTAVLAGRIAMLLAEGVAPKSIAAVTFTEFAASEQFVRVREFVGAMVDGDIPSPLRVALPECLSEEQCRHLAAAGETLDEMTCATIHGFCQRLITPYPVEADIDPGAAVMDRDQADLAFQEITDTWLREELAGEADGLLAELVMRDPNGTLRLVRTTLEHLRRHRDIIHEAPENPAAFAIAFRKAADGFDAFASGAEIEEPDTVVFARRFRAMADEIGFALTAETPIALVSLLVTELHPDLFTQAGGFRKYQNEDKVASGRPAIGLVTRR